MSVGAPDLQRDFGVDYTATALALFVVPTLVGAIVEPPLLVLADRGHRKAFVCGGLAAMGLASVAAGLSPWFFGFAIALTVWFVANGLSVGVAQALVVDDAEDSPEQPMLQWVLAGTLGDLAAPALCAGLGAIGFGWRGAFVASGVAVCAYALVLATQRFPEANDDDDEPSLRDAVRRALSNRRLLLWLGGSWLCVMLDELFVVFGSLHLREALGADLATRSLVLAVDVAGGLVGLAVARRHLTSAPPSRTLAASAAICLASYAAWMAAPTIELSVVLAFVIGAADAPLYPLAHAQAFRALPGEPGLVQAAGVIFTPLDLALPLVLGALADAFGPLAALAGLALQPLLLLVLAGTAAVPPRAAVEVRDERGPRPPR
ncbi:MAG: MFS transporter [Sandaracinaceae bacterium]